MVGNSIVSGNGVRPEMVYDGSPVNDFRTFGAAGPAAAPGRRGGKGGIGGAAATLHRAASPP